MGEREAFSKAKPLLYTRGIIVLLMLLVSEKQVGSEKQPGNLWGEKRHPPGVGEG